LSLPFRAFGLQKNNLVGENMTTLKKTLNKGEWTEIYTFLKILFEREVSLVDEFLSPTGCKFIISGATTRNIKNKYIFVGDKTVDIYCKEDDTKHVRKRIGKMLNSSILEELVQQIKSGNSTFSLPDVEQLQDELDLEIIKGTSSQKADISLDVLCRSFESKDEGFGIKSYLGSPPTLLNASKSTNFLYKIEGIVQDHSEFADNVNSIATKQKIIDRLDMIQAQGGILVFQKLESDTFSYNLELIETHLSSLLSKMILEFFLFRTSSISKNLEALIDKNEIPSVFRNDKALLSSKIKKFLVSSLLGFVPNSEWDGQYSANGVIVVLQDGKQFGLHIIDMTSLENFLFQEIKFDTASTSRHNFGKVEIIDNNLFFKLNLQLRF